MANNTTIQLKRTATTGTVPTNLLANGELAYNLTDKRLFTTNTTGGAVFDAVQNTASDFAITGSAVRLFVGNSTINTTANSTVIKTQNSTVSTTVSVANVVTTNVYASFYSTGNIAAASQLGSGTANTTTFLRGDLTFAVPAGGGGGTPGGSNTQVQFNDSGAFGSNVLFTFDKSSTTLTVGNSTANASLTTAGGHSVLSISDGTGSASMSATVFGCSATGDYESITFGSGAGASFQYFNDSSGTGFAFNTSVANQYTSISNSTGSSVIGPSLLSIGSSLSANVIITPNSVVVANSTKSTTINQSNIITSNVYASFYSTGNIAAASQLGSGTANSTTFLRGDLTFAAPTATAAPAGANTQIQYNDSGSTGAGAGLTFNKTSNTLSVSNNAVISQKLNVGSAAGFDFGTTALVELDGSVNSYVQIVAQNANAGTQASTDLVVTADTGNDSVNFLDIGINSSTYSNATFGLTGPLDAYMYSSNSHLVVGTASDKNIIFHANGTTATDRKMTINTTAVTVNNIPLVVGNSTVNTSHTTTTFTAANSTTNVVINPISISIGNSVANVFANNSTILAANSTTNTVVSPSLITVGNSTSFGSFNNTTLVIAANTTVNTALDTTSLRIQANSIANVTLSTQLLQLYVGNTSFGDIATPSGNAFAIFGKYRAGRIMPSGIEASGFGGIPFQAHLMHMQQAYLLPIPAATTVSALRTVSANTIAFTARTPASGNTFLSATRVSQATGATAGTSTSWRNSTLQWWRGNAAGLGGFYAVTRFGVSGVTTNGRLFVGFKDSATILANGNPSAQTNIIGFSSDSGGGNLFAISANSTVANTIDLGAGFVRNVGNTDWYEASIYAPPNGGTVQYQLTNLKNGNTVTGSYNQTNLPTTTTFLTWQFWGNNGSDAVTFVMDWGGVTIETLY